MSGFTPGPWLEKNRKLIAQDGKSVASATFGTRPYSECNANSCLISAAPDLLEALILQEEIYRMGILNGAHLLQEATSKRKAAIAKATDVKSRA